MPDYKYLIVGGGMTADAAVRGIREVDRVGSIALIGAETHPPYDRPPLTKGLWKGKPLESIWRKTESHGVTSRLGRTVEHLDPTKNQVRDDQGTVYTFAKLLLATGCEPRVLPFGGKEIIYFRTLDDYQKLRALAERGQRFAIIGGGFIGSEIAAALKMNGKDVVMTFPEEGIGSRLFPPGLAKFLNDFYREKGVEVLPGTSATGLETLQGKSVLTVVDAQTKIERKLDADGVVAGIGVQPNVELAKAAGLNVENGIRVDNSLLTSRANIYAAGDVAGFYNTALAEWRRVEHEDNANTMGRMAGLSMAGKAVSFDYLPYFYSDLFDLGYEAVGEVDSRLEIVEDWKRPFREGVVYYLRHKRVKGVLLWNVLEQLDEARRLIAEPGPFSAANLKGRLNTAAVGDGMSGRDPAS